jgi:hypothetical protein
VGADIAKGNQGLNGKRALLVIKAPIRRILAHKDIGLLLQ